MPDGVGLKPSGQAAMACVGAKFTRARGSCCVNRLSLTGACRIAAIDVKS